MATFRFTAGPWNVHEGNETFGPGHRKSIPLEEKMKKYAEIGLAGMQFHDDDAVPDMNNMTEKQIIDYAKDVKAMLDKYGLFAEFVAPRLWFDKRTNDGGFTASRKEDREFAQWRPPLLRHCQGARHQEDPAVAGPRGHALRRGQEPR